LGEEITETNVIALKSLSWILVPVKMFSIDVKHDKNDSKTTVVCFVYEIAEIKATAPRTSLDLNLVEEVF
jgi:hypothetical protein